MTEFEGYFAPPKEQVFEYLLKEYGFDLKDENFKETPIRMKKTWDEILEAHHVDIPKTVERIFEKTFPCQFDEIVMFKNITAWSMCPHHLLPVKMNVSFGYMPDKAVIGLSKVPRFVKFLAKRPLLQEQYTTDLVNTFEAFVKPKGVIVRVEGEHLCYQIRGIKSDTTSVITNALTGIFKDNPSAKDEFLAEIRK